MRLDVRFTCLYVRPKCAIPIARCTGTSRFAWIRLYESLHTYVANIDLVGDPLQGICHVRASELLITKCVVYRI